MKVSKVHTILVIAMLLFGGVVFSSVLSPVSAQTAQPTVTPTIITPPDPVLSAIQTTLTAQQTQLDDLNHQVAWEKGERELLAKGMEWKWGLAGAVVGSIVTILSWLGINSITSAKNSMQKTEKDFAKQVKEIEEKWESHIAKQEGKWEVKSEKNLNKLLEKFDLTNLPIYIPKEQGNLRRRLELSDLRHDEYTSLDKLPSTSGVIVVRIDSIQDQEIFRDFVKKNSPDPQKTAFVLFANPNAVEAETFGCYDNLVAANFPPTVVSNILAIGRGLQIEES